MLLEASRAFSMAPAHPALSVGAAAEEGTAECQALGSVELGLHCISATCQLRHLGRVA